MEARAAPRRAETKEENEEAALFGVSRVGVVAGGSRLLVIGGEGAASPEGAGA